MRATMKAVVLAIVIVSLGGCLNIGLRQANLETQQLAEQAAGGDAEAQYQLGLRYTGGVGLPQHFGRGMSEFGKAAVQGHGPAQYLYGMGFYTGRGQARDFTRARHWLAQAAERGHVDARLQLGNIYLNGQGVDAEPGWGMHWIAQAAELGSSDAQLLFGVARLKGIGTVANRLQGMKWLALAEKGGSKTAADMLGRLSRRQYGAVSIARQAARNWKPLSAGRSQQRQRIRYIQYRLLAEGYPAGSVDGRWGPRTERAARKFLRRYDLGIADGRERLISQLRGLERRPG